MTPPDPEPRVVYDPYEGEYAVVDPDGIDATGLSDTGAIECLTLVYGLPIWRAVILVCRGRLGAVHDELTDVIRDIDRITPPGTSEATR